MKKVITGILMMVCIFGLSACYEQVPAGHKGKIMSKVGFQPEIYPPSKIWLSNNIWNVSHERLYTLETTTQKFRESLSVKLNGQLDITTTLQFRGRIRANPEVVNFMFNDIKMAENDFVVTTAEAYNVYVKDLVRNTARQVISKYTVDNVNKNYERITKELYAALEPKLRTLPIEISDITLGTITLPPTVNLAIADAKSKQMDIEKQQNQTLVDLARYDGKVKIADKEYDIKMKEAQRIADYNKMIGKSITPELLRLRELEVQQTIAENIEGNANVIYMPLPMMEGSSNMRMVK